MAEPQMRGLRNLDCILVNKLIYQDLMEDLNTKEIEEFSTNYLY